MPGYAWVADYRVSGAGFQGALCKIDLGAAFRTLLRLVKFVRKDFNRFVALIAFADEGL